MTVNTGGGGGGGGVAGYNINVNKKITKPYVYSVYVHVALYSHINMQYQILYTK